MTRKNETADRMAAARAAGRRRSGTATSSAAGAEADQDEPVIPRTDPVKVTVEMQPIEHRRLRQFCSAVEIEYELTRVAGAEVLRVLWELMQEDPDLTTRVKRELKRTGGSRRRH